MVVAELVNIKSSSPPPPGNGVGGSSVEVEEVCCWPPTIMVSTAASNNGVASAPITGDAEFLWQKMVRVPSTAEAEGSRINGSGGDSQRSSPSLPLTVIFPPVVVTMSAAEEP